MKTDFLFGYLAMAVGFMDGVEIYFRVFSLLLGSVWFILQIISKILELKEKYGKKK